MNYELINQYGIPALVIIFIVVNLYYRNILNILIFLLAFLALRNVIEDNSALIVAYIVVLSYGIVKNFHLLENFRAIVLPLSNNTNGTDVANTNTNANTNATDVATANAVANANAVSNDDSDSENDETEEERTKRVNNNIYNVDEFISEELINQFISKVKKVDSLMVIKNRTNIYDLKPIIKNIKNNVVEKMKHDLNKDEINKPIIISNDNFIVDGHYRWFVKKNIIENNTNGIDNSELYRENTLTIMIDYDIKTLVRKLKEFKIKFNEKHLSKSVVDIKILKEGKQLIKNIKRDIKLLEENYDTVNRIRLV